jgi:hypothetical protein
MNIDLEIFFVFPDANEETEDAEDETEMDEDIQETAELEKEVLVTTRLVVIGG